MAITAEQRSDILKLCVAMFNASPGADYLNEFAAIVEGGATVGELANMLDDTAVFNSAALYPNFLTDNEFAVKFIDNLVGDLVDQANKDWAVDQVETKLANGESRGDVIWWAAQALDAVEYDNAAWGAAAEAFDNQVEVSEYYAVEQGQSATDLVTLQAVIADVTDDSASVDAAKDYIDENLPSTGETFVFEEGYDNLTGTAGDDSFFAVLSDDTTYNTGDVADGGDGDDTFMLTATTTTGDGNFVELSEIENVVIRNFTDSSLYLNAEGYSDVDNYIVRGGDGSVYVENINDAFSMITLEDFGTGDTYDDTIDFEVADTVFAGDVDEVTVVLDNFGAAPVKVPGYTLDDDVLQGDNDSIDGEYGYLELDNESGDDVVETFNIVSTGDNDRGNFLKISDGYDAATTLNISGTTDLNLNFTDGNDSAELTTVDASGLDADLWLRGMDSEQDLSITGAQGDNDIAAGSYWDGTAYTSKTVTTFDGDDVIRSGYGDFVVDAGNGDNEIHAMNADDLDVTTGDGNDIIRARTSEVVSIAAGAGDDAVYVSGLDADDSVDGGEGAADMLVFYEADGEYNASAATAAEDETFADRFQNFEIVKLCDLDGGTVDMAYLNDIQHVALGYSANDAILQGLSDGATLEFQYENSGSDVTVELTDTEGEETFNVNLASSPEKTNWHYDSEAGWVYDQLEGGGDDFGELTVAGVETINITTENKCKDFDMLDGDLEDGIDPSFITVTLDLDVDALETLTITGPTGLDLSGLALTTVETVDATGLDGEFYLDLTGNANDVTVTAADGYVEVYGGDGADTITVGDGDDVIFGGADADVITAGDGDNLIYGGDGADVITAGSGANEIYGEAGNDTITVGAGSVIDAGAGLDTINLGSGVTEDDFDAIVYNAVTESQGTTVDVISGFQVDVQSTDDITGDDVVDTDDLVNDVLNLSALTFTGTAVYTGEANGYGAVLTSLDQLGLESRAVLDSSTSILYVDVDASGTLDDADMAIELVGVTELSDANFLFTVS